MGNRRRNTRNSLNRSLRSVSGNQLTGFCVEEVISFSVQVGLSTVVSLDTLTSLPARTNFRVKRWDVEALQAFVPATTSLPGYYCPAALQCQILEGTAASVTSPLQLLGASVSRVRLVPRPDYPWIDYGVTKSTGLFRITAVCIGPPDSSGTKAYVRGVVRAFIECMPEVCASTCPAISSS